MPVLVVEGLELAECVEQVGLVPDQGSVKKLATAGLIRLPVGRIERRQVLGGLINEYERAG
jgi:hypothetical protein